MTATEGLHFADDLPCAVTLRRHDWPCDDDRRSDFAIGNGLWVTSLSDPDGYKIDFQSLTDVPEDTVLSDD